MKTPPSDQTPDENGITDEDRRLAALADARPGGNLDTLSGTKNDMVRRVQMQTRVNCNPGSNAHRLCCAVAVLIENNRDSLRIGSMVFEALLSLPVNYLGDISAKNKQAAQIESDEVKAQIKREIEEEFVSSRQELHALRRMLEDARGAHQAIREELADEFANEQVQLDIRESKLAQERTDFNLQAAKAITDIKKQIAEMQAKA